VKIGLFADVHGNLPALEAVWARLRDERCDAHLFLGDVCGYYFQGNETISLLQTIPRLTAVSGNHDALFLRLLENQALLDDYSAAFGLSFRLLRTAIRPGNLEFLRRLPRQAHIAEANLAAFHGSPWRPLDEYVYPDSAHDRFSALPWRFVCMGHTHRPLDVVLPGVHLVNPGSVGQPRDGGWPSYAVLDTVADTVAVRRVPFDVGAMIAAVEAHPEAHPYLTEVLRRIRTEAGA
jgi:predicted phosphodiesterase